MNTDRFKFRVWSEKLKRYYYEVRLTVDGDLVPSKWLELDSIPDLGRIVILEQCTGLRDRNNKLIYEGDVFEADVLNSFDGDKFIGQKICGTVAYYPDEACFTFAAYAPMNLGNLEIIGTIHDDQFRDAAEMVERQNDSR